MDQKNGESISVFVSYRRKDSPGHAGRIRDALRGRFGDDRVFYDVATLEGGVDFAVAIRDAIERTAVFVVIVGPLWGQRRIWDRLVDAPDWVRFEIEYARQLAKPILPIVVAGAAMPAGRSLHPGIRFLSTIQVVALRDDSWDSDVKRLLDRLPIVAATPATLAPAIASPPPRRAKRYGALAAAIVLGALVVWLARFAGPSRAPTPDRPTITAPVPDAVTLTPQTAETPGITAPPPTAAPSPKVLRYGVRATNRPPTTGTIEVQPLYSEGLVSATRFVFTAKGVTDPDGDALTYTWDFGDGTSPPKSAPSVTKVYERVSRFDVKLLVSDGNVADDLVAAETKVTVRDVTGTWNLTIGRDPSARVLLPTRYAVTLVQQGNTLSGRIVPDGGTRSTVLTGSVEHPNRVYFGSEHAWWNDDQDAYFDLEMGSLGIQMKNRNVGRCGPQIPCLGALANKQ